MALVQKKKGGPYSKNDKDKRQKEVFRLHFDLGYSAVKISEMMSVNRNTVNKDINYWYSILMEEWYNFKIEDWGVKQLHRLESQSSLLKELDSIEEPSVRCSIKRMIIDIDSRIMNFVTKVKSTQKQITDEVIDLFNHFVEKKEMKTKVIDVNSLMEVSPETAEKITELIREDKKNRYNITE